MYSYIKVLQAKHKLCLCYISFTSCYNYVIFKLCKLCSVINRVCKVICRLYLRYVHCLGYMYVMPNIPKLYMIT